MRIPRIFIDEPLRAGIVVLLPEQGGEHVARVLRLERGHPLILFNGDGHEYDATLASLAKRAVTAEVERVREVDRESKLHITLAQGVARGEKMDWILQKVTELGVARVVPLVTERTEVKLDEERAERRVAHWRSVVAGACEQSGRTRVPEIEMPVRLDRWLGDLGDDAALRLALLPEGDAGLREFAQMDDGVVLCVGPEGGFSENDVGLLKHARFHGLRLGPRILRTETAGIAAMAALQALAGDL
ncbi:MAG: 16S rRNA (uracil(1498)-N(3))-methyltransferase [Rudaea sp.]|uniref:16S rRNA (uracil(1498)-N(3))-methyltransferase n=1 Tax=unclassified Rudaea TaxID=2627037 RepID=UPI0010F7BBE4|nr:MULTISPECIES: 16S rRNA (uracil(1498)-N(3))-methyltransferase [unclassified Rudaea]MBN8886492.1 16S rRNA (uracil(1498)-N(3))-methyltransferase [Rudaea sp.]